MLVLTQKQSQPIVIGDKAIEIKVLQIDNNSPDRHKRRQIVSGG